MANVESIRKKGSLAFAGLACAFLGSPQKTENKAR